MKITLYGRLVSDPLMQTMQVTVYCIDAVAVPAGLFLKQQNSPEFIVLSPMSTVC